MTAAITYFRSNTWCHDDRARTQEQLQEIARQIRQNCKCTDICGEENVCTIYQNENLGLRYWIHDDFGNISEIIQERTY